MGIYLNPDNTNFRESLRRKIYVDKTMMLDVLNGFMDEGNKYICVSRPRRFGKTTAGNMISAYYSRGCDSHEIFSGLKIGNVPGYEEKLNQYNVIKLDLNSEYMNARDKSRLIDRITERVVKEMRGRFPEAGLSENDSLGDAILKAYESTGESFVILIDEYDVLVREEVDQELFGRYLDFLNSLFKSDVLRSAIALAYLTGILPIVRDKVQSKLNVFREYTILDAGELAPFIGFTAEEVQELCGRFNINYDECQSWYDGYRQHGYEIYNPESVVMALENRRFTGYWNMTSTYRVIADRIREDLRGTKEDVILMLGGESVDVDEGTFMNTLTDFRNKNDVFMYLIHLGYLAYDLEEETCRIPNREVQKEWIRAIADDEDYEKTNEIIRASRELLNETLKGDAEAVEKALDKSHIHVTSNRSYNNEDALGSAVYLAYIYAVNKYHIVREMTSGKGFADVVFIPVKGDFPALIVELKRNSSAESAITQIREKQYFECMASYSGEVLFVGINYDEDSKKHECRIERFEKE